MEKLDVQIVCPGHGPLAGKNLLAKQKRYFVELRGQVKKGMRRQEASTRSQPGSTCRGTRSGPARTRKRTRTTPKHVYEELTGKIDHDKLGMLPYPLNYVQANPAQSDASSGGR